MVIKKQFTINQNGIKPSYYRTYEASPIFTFKNAEMLTATYWLIDLAEDNTDIKKFLPLSNLSIANNSTQDIYIYINQGTIAKIVPAGTIISFDKSSIPAVRSIKVYNAGTGTADANLIELSIYREGVIVDDAFAKMHKAFYKFLFTR